MRDNITSSAGGGGGTLLMRWSVVRTGPREHGTTDFTQQQSAYSKKVTDYVRYGLQLTVSPSLTPEGEISSSNPS
jgi:hypothetical protein